MSQLVISFFCFVYFSHDSRFFVFNGRNHLRAYAYFCINFDKYYLFIKKYSKIILKIEMKK